MEMNVRLVISRRLRYPYEMTFSFENALALSLATAILGLSPGPAVFATVGRSLSMPFRRVALFILGIVIGDFVFAMLAMGGLALLISQHALYFSLLKCVGGGYLLYLGMMAMVYASGQIRSIEKIAPESPLTLVGSGFILTSGNPKDLLFFVSFLPAFLDLRSATGTDMAMASAVIVVTFIGTLSFYAGLGAVAGKWLKTPRTVLWLDRAAGLILVLAGLAVLFGDSLLH